MDDDKKSDKPQNEAEEILHNEPEPVQEEADGNQREEPKFA